MAQPPKNIFLQAAIEEARQGPPEGGFSISSVLSINAQFVGRDPNRRARKGSAILQAEKGGIENAGRLKASDCKGGSRADL